MIKNKGYEQYKNYRENELKLKLLSNSKEY